MTDPEGVIRYWNPAATTIFGYTAAEAIGRGPFTFLVAPEKADALLAEYSLLASHGQQLADEPPHRQSRSAQERREPSRWSGRWLRYPARAASGPARC